VKCPVHQPCDYDQYGCGGSAIEGFCPATTYCPNPTVTQPCPNGTDYCPTGVQEALSCPSGFVCLDGRARRKRLLRTVIIAVIIAILVFAFCAEISQWLVLNKRRNFGLKSERYVYFKKQNKTIDRLILIELSERIGQQCQST
jgi:hypothetical protein